MQQTMLRYAFTNNNKYFVNEGYLPSLKKSTPFNAAEIAHQALGFIGFSSNVPNDLRWHNNDEISYDNDYIMPNIMLKTIFANNSKRNLLFLHLEMLMKLKPNLLFVEKKFVLKMLR